LKHVNLNLRNPSLLKLNDSSSKFTPHLAFPQNSETLFIDVFIRLHKWLSYSLSDNEASFIQTQFFLLETTKLSSK